MGGSSLSLVAAACAVTACAGLSAVAPPKSLKIGAANLDWPSIGFEYRPTRAYAHYKFRDGTWDGGSLAAAGTEATVAVNIAATGLHYGQSLFEGLKAFACADGSVRLFRPKMNAARMARGAARVCMEPPSEALFIEACSKAVMANLDYVPPHGSGGALYVRPLLFGSGPRIGLQPADAYDLLVLVTPVGDYYQGGLGKPAKAKVIDDYDRAAPRGVGSVKLAGNYAPDLKPNTEAKEEGFPIGLYLDAATREFVEEFSTSNFVAVDKATGAYVTPDSATILPSITNDSLMKIAADDLGLKVERRPVSYAEIENGAFSEVAACGTAVVLTPVGSFTRGGKTSTIDANTEPGATCAALYKRLTDIQKGDAPDPNGWTHTVCDTVDGECRM